MTETSAHRGLPERWLLPPPPDEPWLARRWHALSFEDRRELVRVGPADLEQLKPADVEMVAGLARARLATAWRPLVVAAVLGWLVLMTVWGFGRSTYPDQARVWLLGGVASGVAAWTVATLRVATRLRRARALAASASGT